MKCITFNRVLRMESLKSDAAASIGIEQSCDRGGLLSDIYPSADSSSATSDDRQSNETITVHM